MSRPSQNAADMFSCTFPGEPWTLTYELTEEQDASMQRLCDKYTDSDDERTRLLKMLGAIPSEGARNPHARDAWTRKPDRRHDNDPRLTRNQTHCKRGHIREQHTVENRAGVPYCIVCKAADGKRRSAEAAERRKKEAA